MSPRRLWLLSALGSFACGPSLPFSPAGPSAAPDPSTLGPYPVGVQTRLFVDPARTSSTGRPRQLVTEIWYPAAESARGRPGTRYLFADLLPERKRAALGALDLGGLDTTAVRDAPPASDGAPYPLILFSHGSGGARIQATYLTVALASHGYVVVAPDHEGNTLTDAIRGEAFTDPLMSFIARPTDLSFLLDRLTAEVSTDPLAARIDFAQVGAAGHSFGGVTVLREAGLEPRIRAVVAQAPAGYALAWVDVERPLESLGIPVMLQVGDKDRTLPGTPVVESYWPHLPPERWALDFANAGHFSFTDLCTVDVSKAASVDINIEPLSDGCGPDNTPSSIVFPVVRRFAIGMFNAALRGSQDSLQFLRVEPGGEISLRQ